MTDDSLTYAHQSPVVGGRRFYAKKPRQILLRILRAHFLVCFFASECGDRPETGLASTQDRHRVGETQLFHNDKVSCGLLLAPQFLCNEMSEFHLVASLVNTRCQSKKNNEHVVIVVGRRFRVRPA